MAQYKTDAIILAVHNWGEADKMVTLFSRDLGIIKAAAYGCRRPRSALAGGMQMFCYLDVQLGEGQRLDIVRQCEMKLSFKALREDLDAMAYATFVAELVLELCPERHPEPQIFDKLLQAYAAFSKHNPRIVALAVAYQFLDYTGYQLNFDTCVVCGTPIQGDAFFSLEQRGVLCSDCKSSGVDVFSAKLRMFIYQLRELDWLKPPVFSVSGGDLVLAETLLLLYLQNLLEKPLKSLAFIQQLSMLPGAKKM